jgi:hypothetical protein
VFNHVQMSHIAGMQSWRATENDNPDVIACTAVNQCLLNGPVITSADPSTPLPSGTHVLPAALRWVHHGNVGYYNLDGATLSALHLSNAVQNGSWADINAPESPALVSLEVFNLQLCHGHSPANASYAYAVVPNVTADAVSACLVVCIARHWLLFLFLRFPWWCGEVPAASALSASSESSA